MKERTSNLRLLPMGKVEFKTYEEVMDFLLNGLKRRNGKYYYRRKSMANEDKIKIAFQYGGKIVATADLLGQSEEGLVENDVQYNGFYIFDMSSMKACNPAIDAEQIRTIVPDFKGFNQSTQYLPDECLVLF